MLREPVFDQVNLVLNAKPGAGGEAMPGGKTAAPPSTGAPLRRRPTRPPHAYLPPPLVHRPPARSVPALLISIDLPGENRLDCNETAQNDGNANLITSSVLQRRLAPKRAWTGREKREETGEGGVTMLACCSGTPPSCHTFPITICVTRLLGRIVFAEGHSFASVSFNQESWRVTCLGSDVP